MKLSLAPMTRAMASLHPKSGRIAAIGRLARAIAWIAAYVSLAILPLLIWGEGTSSRGGGFWWDFALALGFGGLALLGLQSVLTARFRRATAPFGVDVIYYFHRLAAIAGVGLVAAHYAILRVRYGEALGALNPLTAPWPMTAGRIAFALFLTLIVSSVWRRVLRIEYDRWRVAHAVMALVAVLLAIAHAWRVGASTATVGEDALWILFSLLWVIVVVYVRIGRPWNLLREPYRVVQVRRERGRAWTLTLRPEGHRGLQFHPGQFAWLVLRASPFHAKDHPFSFSSSAAEPTALQFTIKELGDFTRTIGDVKVGELAYVDGPHGIFTVDYFPHEPGFVFIAGGVGIAPIMSMLRTLADRGDRRPLRLLYGSRRWVDVIFREEIAALMPRLDLVVVHTLQEPPIAWVGPQGVLDEAFIRSALPEEARSAVFFLCGPKPMADSVHRSLRRLGVGLSRIHCELFEMA